MNHLYTPLPWAMVYGTDGHHLIFGEDGPIARVAVRADAEEQQANANLFLAAPELLAACQRVVRLLEQQQDTDPVLDSTLKQVRAALAKAEGR